MRHKPDTLVEDSLRNLEKDEMTNDKDMNLLMHNYNIADGRGYAINAGHLSHPKKIGWALNYNGLKDDIVSSTKKYATEKVKKFLVDKSSTSFCVLSISAKADDSGMIEILYHTLGK